MNHKFINKNTSKRAIVTRADDGVKDWIELTHPIMRKYAEKCNADFIVLSHAVSSDIILKDGAGLDQSYYRILAIRDLFEKYDRILYLDTDMLINKNCPDLFDIVPEDKIGAVFEDVGSRINDRMGKIRQMQIEWNFIDWRNGYINEGCFLISKKHKDIFLPHNNQYWVGWAGSQSHLSFNINKLKFEVFELSYHWNHMVMFSEPWNKNPDRFESNIIHYAGDGIWEKEIAMDKLEQAKRDYDVIYGNKNLEENVR
jgi:lipopolysaccharide biosynthesis glycosyltransferase